MVTLGIKRVYVPTRTRFAYVRIYALSRYETINVDEFVLSVFYRFQPFQVNGGVRLMDFK